MGLTGDTAGFHLRGDRKAPLSQGAKDPLYATSETKKTRLAEGVGGGRGPGRAPGSATAVGGIAQLPGPGGAAPAPEGYGEAVI